MHYNALTMHYNTGFAFQEIQIIIIERNCSIYFFLSLVLHHLKRICKGREHVT